MTQLMSTPAFGERWVHVKTGRAYVVSGPKVKVKVGKKWELGVVYYWNEGPRDEDHYVRTMDNFLDKFRREDS